MAQITITIPDLVIQRVVDAFVNVYALDFSIDPQQNKNQFAKQKVINFITSVVNQNEVSAAVYVANNAASIKVAQDIILT